MPLPALYSKDSVDNLLADKLALAGGTMTGGLTLSATGIIFSDSTTLTTAPAGGTLAADQLTAGVVATNPAAGPTTAGDVLQYDGTVLMWAAGGGVAWGSITGTLSSQTDLQTALDGKLAASTVNSGTGSYTLVIGDANNILYYAAGYSGNIEIPYDSNVNFPVGTKIIIAVDGSSSPNVTFSSQDTMTPLPVLLNFNSITSSAVKTIVKVAADRWIMD